MMKNKNIFKETDLNTLEIDTPEELKLRLEKKIDKIEDQTSNKYLERISKIADSIHSTSEEKWDQIRSELDSNEEAEIVSILKSENTNIENYLTQWASEEKKKEIAQTEALNKTLKWTAAAWASTWIVKSLWYIEKFEKAFSEAWTLFSEWKYLAAFMAFIWGVFWTWKPEWEKNKEKENIKIDKKEQVSKNDKFLTTTSIFVWLAKRWKNKELNDIIYNEWFNKLKYSEILKLSKLDDNKLKKEINKKWILKWHNDITQIKETLEILTSWNGEKIIKEIYKGKDINDITIKDLMTWLSSELIIIKDINSSNVSTLIDIPSTLEIKFEQWEVWWNLEWKLKSLWISKNIIVYALTWDYKFDNINNVTEQIEWASKYKDLSENEKNKLNEMIKFWFEIQEMLKTNDNLNLWSVNLNNELINKPLWITDILKLYTVTWWNSDFESMNGYQKTYLYFSVSSILDSRWNQSEDWAYKINLVNEIIKATKNESSKIPDDVKNVLSTIWDSATANTVDIAREFWAEIKWAILERPLLWAAILLVTLIYPFAQRKAIIQKLTK